MRQGRRQIVTALVLGLIGASASAASSDHPYWIARLTGIQSCEREVRSTLGEAVSDLERRNIIVSEAMTGRLAGRFFCSGCQCPDGSYNIVKIDKTEDYEAALRSGDWESVQSKDILPASAPDANEGDYRILPVSPEF